MKIKQICVCIIIALLSLMLLLGCAVGPAEESSVPTEAPAENAELSVEPVTVSQSGESIYKVSSVDELLMALGSDRVIFLEKAYYELSEAKNHGSGSSDAYYWEECFDGYELVISGVERLRIVGEEGAELVTLPRYANVVRFEDCADISVESLVIGHTPAPGVCSGGVLYFDGCSDVNVRDSQLYGCGTIGISAINCKRVYANSCQIYDCSLNAAYASSSYDLRLENCSVHSNGQDYAQSLFHAENCNGFAVVNCDINGNYFAGLLSSYYSKQVYLLGCTVKDNEFTGYLLDASGYSPIVDKCSFEQGVELLYKDLPAFDRAGKELSGADIYAMTQEHASYPGPRQAAPLELDEAVNAEGLREVRVSTVDEFLAAIGSDTVIQLSEGVYDLSTATDYGAYGTDYYYWHDMFDGPGLVISGVSNMSIRTEGDCTIAAIPRYANVLNFVNCDNISLSGFTAGHTEEPGSCAGGVLDFENCWGIEVDNCRLFGCGIMGIRAYYCSELDVKNTEIYDCSQGAVALYTVMDAEFENMDIHDCMTPEFSLHDCMDVSYDGTKLQYGDYILQADGKIASYGRYDTVDKNFGDA